MTTSPLLSLYQRIHGTLSSPTQSVTVYTSEDRVHSDAYPPWTSGFSTSPFAELPARFAVQITGPHIQAAIDLAPWPQDEVDLQYGYSVRIVQDLSQLISAADGWQSAAFVRDDSSLVIWHDNEDNILSNWSDIASRLQNRFGNALLNPGDTDGEDIYRYFHTDAPEGSLLQDDSLPLLNELSHLVTVPGPATPPPTLPSPGYPQPYLHPHLPWVQGESPSVGGLQLALQVLTTSSPSSYAPSSSFGGTPFTIELPAISPALISTADLPEDDDGTSNLSLDFSTSDSVESPRSSDGSQDVPTQATFRRHSFGETGAATAGGKTKRGLGADDEEYVSRFNVTDETVQGDFFPPVANARHRPSKRRRSITQATSTSAPALFPIPLPTVEHAGNSGYIDAAHDESPTLHPPQASTSTQRRGRRRTGTGAGRATRAKRTPCEHCGKTFSRMQDAQRHATTSCVANPEKSGVQCPECNSVLSRLDAAQRHWRGHENPTSPPPEWMNRP